MKPLTAERVGDLVGVRHGETLWDWREAVLDGEPGRAVALLPSMLAQPGVSGVKLVTALGTALVGLGIARAHYDRGLRGRSLEAAVLKSLLERPALRPARLQGGGSPLEPLGPEVARQADTGRASGCTGHRPGAQVHHDLR